MPFIRVRLVALSCAAFLVACPTMTPGVDAGLGDVGIADTRPSTDARADDGGSPDTGAPDASATDAAVTDSSAIDASTPAHRIDDIVALLAGSPADAVAIEAALHDVAWSEGWPLHEGTRWLFATRYDDGPSGVSVVGDINGWTPGRWPAESSATGVHFWVVVDESDFDVSPVGSKYKWHTAPDDYRAPPESVAYGYDAFGEFGWVRPPLDQPHLERFVAFRSAFLEDARAFRAYLPAGFVAGSAAAAHLRTLFLHDGQNVFDPGAFYGGWHVDDALAAHPDVVALAIDNAPDRMDAYTHVVDTIAGSTVGGRADDYARLVGEEALPFFRARYGIVAEDDSLMIAGSSLGGLVTMYFAMEHTISFGCGAALSSTVGWGSFSPTADSSRALARAWSAAAGHGTTALYLDTGGGVTGACFDGDADGIDDDADDADNYCVNVQMRDVLRGLGYADGTDLTYAWAPGEGHNEAAWAARVPGALTACTAMGWTAP